jgi:hypothetical protein
MRSARKGVYAHGDEVVSGAEHDSSQETVQMEDVQTTTAAVPQSPFVPKQTRFAVPAGGPQKLERVIRNTTKSGKLATLVLQAPVAGSHNLTVEDVLAGSAEARQLIFNKKRWEAGDEGNAVLAKGETRVGALSAEALRMKTKPEPNEPTPLFRVELAGQPVVALYDTGANSNVISRELADLLNLRVEPLTRTKVLAYDGKVGTVSGIVRSVMVNVSGESVDDAAEGTIRLMGTMYVMPELDSHYDIILGQPFRRACRSSIGYDEGDRTVMFFTDPDTRMMIWTRPCNEEVDSAVSGNGLN